jgi:hypothetical protein
MPDYSQHRPQDWEWCNEYRSRMGDEAWWKYINDVYGFLLSMRPGNFLSVEKNVKPENVDLFIKVCCLFIQEQQASSFPGELYHIFGDDYAEIRCKKK